MADDLEWAETLGKSAGQVNRAIKRLRDQKAALVDALTIFMREWDAYGENDSGYSNDPAGVMNDAWKHGFIDQARKALSTLDEG